MYYLEKPLIGRIDRLQVKNNKLSFCTLCISTFRRAQSCVISQRFSSVMRKKNIPCDLKRHTTVIKINLLTLLAQRLKHRNASKAVSSSHTQNKSQENELRHQQRHDSYVFSQEAEIPKHPSIFLASLRSGES